MAILFAGNVEAVAPTTTVFSGEVGINVEANLMDIYKFGEPRWTVIHLFNTTNGYQITNATNDNITCSMHLRNSQGFELMSVFAVANTDHWDLNGSAGVNTPIGHYAWTLTCQDDTAQVGGYVSGFYEITATGETETINLTLFIILILISTGILLAGFLFKNYVFSTISGMGFLLTGAYIMINGLGSLATANTQMLSVIIIGFGAIVTITSALELANVSYSQGGEEDY